MRLLTLQNRERRDLWAHPNKIWPLVIVCECAHYRLSRLVKEPLYCNTGSDYPQTRLENVLLVLWQRATPQLPLSGFPIGARKECMGAMEWDSSPVHLTLTVTVYTDFGMCHRFVRSVIIKIFLPGVLSVVIWCWEFCTLPLWFCFSFLASL